MTNVKMKATDTLHISSLGPNSLTPGEEFEVSGQIADDLEKRGLASRVTDEPEPVEKAEPAPENKAEAEPENKSVVSASRKRGR